jgi:hypothetical protein
MCRSGLLETTAVTATVLGGAIPRGVQSEGRISATEGGSPGQFEFATLRKLQAYCEATPDARVIYFHNSAWPTGLYTYRTFAGPGPAFYECSFGSTSHIIYRNGRSS